MGAVLAKSKSDQLQRAAARIQLRADLRQQGGEVVQGDPVQDLAKLSSPYSNGYRRL